jgi:DNA-binding beta-propeller fold protein YncE
VNNHIKRLRVKGWVLVLWVIVAAMFSIALDRAPSTAANSTSTKATSMAQSTGGQFTEFESGQVRPIAMSPNGNRLFAVNTPDNTLEIFGIMTGGLALEARVPVGLEPVAVAARDDNEVWVVNHLSDSVSVVSLTGRR